MTDNWKPISEASHPSEFIQEELDARGWSLNDLALRMQQDDVRTSRLALDIYFEVGPHKTGCRLGKSMAADIGQAFGVNPQFFINLENTWLESKGVNPNPPQGQECD